MRASRLSTLLVAAAIATFAGCGGDDKKDTSANAGDSTTATTPDTATTTPSPTPSSAETTTTPTPKGTADPEPGLAVQAYFTALSKRDTTSACGLMDGGMQQAAVRFATVNLKAKGVQTCSAALRSIIKPANESDLKKISDVEILSSTVNGSAATVKVKRASRDATLTKSAGRWLISGGIFAD